MPPDKDPEPEHTPASSAPDTDVPDTLVEAIRWDVIVLLLALMALGANLVVPDELSSAILLFLGLAVLWIGYRITVKVRAFRARNR